MHVHRFDLGTEATVGLQVAKDDELAGTDHLAARFGHQHASGPGVDLGPGGGIRGEVRGVLFTFDQGSVLEQLDDAPEVLQP
jgi:hypothetical protein